MATVTDLLEEIKEQLNALDIDAAKVDKGQKAAGTRVARDSKKSRSLATPSESTSWAFESEPLG